ncbi:MAG: hypothetical protein HXX16_06300 [Bacteroidales bacterium]|nr:hypothetical protein [Bacteroidales bacterium]
MSGFKTLTWLIENYRMGNSSTNIEVLCTFSAAEQPNICRKRGEEIVVGAEHRNINFPIIRVPNF